MAAGMAIEVELSAVNAIVRLTRQQVHQLAYI